MYEAPGQYRPIEYAEPNENLVEGLNHMYSVATPGWTCLFGATGTVNSGHDFVTACVVFFAGMVEADERPDWSEGRIVELI